MDTRETVIKKLQEFDMDTNVKEQTMKHLCKIQETLDTLKHNQEEAAASLKENKPALNRIASMGNIARQTFYNNPLLTEYIEQYWKANAAENPFDTIERLRNEIRIQDERIKNMVKRDAETLIYKNRISELEEQIHSLKETVKSQEMVIQGEKPLRDKINILQKQLEEQKERGSVLDFPT